jgi:cytochrome c peroxidase
MLMSRWAPWRAILLVTAVCGGVLIWMFTARAQPPDWELANPIVPLPAPPLGIDSTLTGLKEPPTPERVRLGRWLFFDQRLSVDSTVSCASCHVPDRAFSEQSAVSMGIRSQKGGRKAPSFINQAWTIYPHFFWDGRAGSLETQALGPIANPIEMGNSHENMLATLRRTGYGKYFKEAFGTDQMTKERVSRAIADYERTRMSGNSPWDRWRKNRDESAVSTDVKTGHDLFLGRAGCSQCHLGQNFTDSTFHNLGVGWNPKTKTFADEGRRLATTQEKDRGAFKTPTLREVGLHAPFMHDGSVKSLREVIELYNRGGIANPDLDPKIQPLNLGAHEIDALVEFLEALQGEGYQDSVPKAFPGVHVNDASATEVRR